MRLTKEIVIKTASDMADENGLDHVSLKVVAEALNIRTPSLYNHIDGLDNLLREVAHRGMKTMNERLYRAAACKSGDLAVKAVSAEYLRFMIEHPGVYETIQWAAWHGTDETQEIFSNYKSLLEKLILSLDLNRPDVDEIMKLIMGLLHGYTTLNLGEALKAPEKAYASLNKAMETLLWGIRQTYQSSKHTALDKK